MTKLVDLETVRKRRSLPDDSDTNDQLNLSIEAATIHLISILRTEFDRGDYVDTFWVDPEQEPWVGDTPFLYLSRGFVFQDPNAIPDPIEVTVKIAGFLSELTDAEEIDQKFYSVDEPNGLIRLSEEDDLGTRVGTRRFAYGDQFYAEVSYTAGFTDVTDAYGQIYENVPLWLQEAATIVSLAIFDGDLDCGVAGSDCNKRMMAFVSRYIRYFPYARKTMLP